MSESRAEMLNDLLDQWYQVANVLKEIAAELEPYEKKQAELREMIVSLGLELGESVLKGWEHEKVELQYRSGYPGKSWDTKGLLGYAEHDEKIKKFLIVKDVPPTVVVRLKKTSK